MPRFGLRLEPEFNTEQFPAGFVLAHGGTDPVLQDMEPHQLAVNLFLERIDRKKPEGRVDCGLRLSGNRQMVETPRKNTNRNLFKPAALDVQPRVERLAATGLQIEQRTAPQGGSLGQRIRRAPVRAAIEAYGIDLDRLRAKTHLLRPGIEAVPRLFRQRLPQPRQGLAQVGTGLNAGDIAPQQHRKPLARHRLSRVQREIGKQGPAFAPWHIDLATARRMAGELTEEGQTQFRHELNSPSIGPRGVTLWVTPDP